MIRGASLVVAIVASLAGCGERALRASGEACSASSECESGLLCDFGQTPPQCAGTSTVADAQVGGPVIDAAPDAVPGTPDAMPVIDAAVPDAATPDASTPDAAI